VITPPDDWGPVGLTEEGRWTIAVLGFNKRTALRDKWRSHAGRSSKIRTFM
jgi:hypothetical protein